MTTTELTAKGLTEWYVLYIQYINGYHLSNMDWSELLSLNHLVMEASHKVHNDNMLDIRKESQHEKTNTTSQD